MAPNIWDTIYFKEEAAALGEDAAAIGSIKFAGSGPEQDKAIMEKVGKETLDRLKIISKNMGISLAESGILLSQALKDQKTVVIESGMDMDMQDWMEIAVKAKELFGPETVIDVGIKRPLMGGARVAVGGNWIDNTVISRWEEWQSHVKQQSNR